MGGCVVDLRSGIFIDIWGRFIGRKGDEPSVFVGVP